MKTTLDLLVEIEHPTDRNPHRISLVGVKDIPHVVPAGTGIHLSDDDDWFDNFMNLKVYSASITLGKDGITQWLGLADQGSKRKSGALGIWIDTNDDLAEFLTKMESVGFSHYGGKTTAQLIKEYSPNR